MNTVFFDVDTQIDFLYPAGGLYVPGAENIVDAVARLNNYCATHGVLLISDVDAHTENDPEFHDWPTHCIAGTLGQRKPAATLIPHHVRLSSKNPLKAWPSGAKQILLEKQSLDAFSNPHLPSFLEHLGAERFVVYGVVTEICVDHVVRGLLNFGKRVELVTDAVRHLDEEAARRTFRDLESAGGSLVTAESVLSRS